MPRFQLCLSNTLLVGQFVLFHFVYSIQQSIAKLTASLSGVKKVSLLLVRVYSLPFSSLTTVSTTSVNHFRASGSSKASAIPARIKMELLPSGLRAASHQSFFIPLVYLIWLSRLNGDIEQSRQVPYLPQKLESIFHLPSTLQHIRNLTCDAYQSFYGNHLASTPQIARYEHPIECELRSQQPCRFLPH